MIDLRQKREELKLSQEDIANITGVTRGTVSKWEAGDIANMKRDKIALYARALRISPLELLGLPTDNHQDDGYYGYPYFNGNIAAGIPSNVDPFTVADGETLQIANAIMGKYAGDTNIIITNIDGESMNRIIPNGSLIAIKKVDSVYDLNDGDIVVFQDGGEMAVKRFYFDRRHNIINFTPDSTDPSFHPINYVDDDLDDVTIIGRVVIYQVVM